MPPSSNNPSLSDVKLALQKCFPDKRALITDELATQVQLKLKSGGTIPAATAVTCPKTPSVVAYYEAEATHIRPVKPWDAFVGHISMARILLPASGKVDIPTDIGTALAADRLLPSLKDVQIKMRREGLDYVPQRVELITPIRNGGFRFAAIAVYLGYKNVSDAAPSFYILEAGMATGQPMVLYPAKTIDTKIFQQGSYTPTPFSSADHWYEGNITMAPNNANELTWLNVAAHPNSSLSSPPYIRISVEFTRLNSAPSNGTFANLVGAAGRVASIGKVLGTDIPLRDILAVIGDLEPWIQKPTATPPAAKKSAVKKVIAAVTKKAATTPAKKTSAAPAKKVVATPAKKVVATPAKKVVATPAKKVVATPAKKVVATPAKKVVATPAKKVVATPAKKVVATPAKKVVATPAKKVVATPAKKVVATPAKKVVAKKTS